MDSDHLRFRLDRQSPVNSDYLEVARRYQSAQWIVHSIYMHAVDCVAREEPIGHEDCSRTGSTADGCVDLRDVEHVVDRDELLRLDIDRED